jgi:tetratricopeptide (TPR) repeat protein
LHWLALAYSLAGRTDEALENGRAGLEIADALDLDEIRANLLSTIGITRCGLGDVGGLVDQERSVEIARAANSVDVIRSLGNLASTQLDFGQVARGHATLDKAAVEGQRFGSVWYRDWIALEQAVYVFFEGDWDAALAVVDPLVAEIEAGNLTTFMESPTRTVRARIRLARGDVRGAVDDLERSVELGRAARNPQLLYPGLAAFAAVQVELGAPDAAAAALDELLARLRERPVLASAFWLVDLSYALTALGREADLNDAFGHLPAPTPWTEAARAYASKDYRRAAEMFAEIGSKPDEAYARLRSGEELEVRRALEFYRSVGATRYLDEGERMLARSA